MRKSLALLALLIVVLGSTLPQVVVAQGPGPERVQPADRPDPVPAAAPDWGGTWQRGPDTTFPQAMARFDGGYYPGTGMVYFMGGRLADSTTTGDVWQFDPTTELYSLTGATLPTPISNYTMNLLQDANGWGFYVLGGRPSAGGVTNVVQVYYPDTNTAVQLDPADNYPGAGTCTSGLNAVYDNKVYVAGGFDATNNYAETWIFDPMGAVGSKWTQIPSANLNLARAYIMGVAVDDMIYAIGGSWYDAVAVELVDVEMVEVLDPNASTPVWNDAAAADLPEPCSASRAWGFDSDSPYADPDGTPLAGKMVSGCGVWPDPNTHVLVYDAGLDFWEAFPYLNGQRRDVAGEFIPEATVSAGRPGMWLWGGYDNVGAGDQVTTTVEYYDLGAAGECSILLVDDDWDQYSGEPYNGTGTYYYTSTLQSLGYSYDRWDVWTQGDPGLADMQAYDVVVWFTGYAWSETVTPTNEADLAAYLDGGGNLFLSGYDYLFDAGLTAFGTGYLGIDAYVEDTGDIDPVGNAGDPVGDGLGPYTLVVPTSWPSGTTAIEFADQVDPLAGASAPFRYQASTENNSTDVEGGAFRTVFLAWPFEGLGDLGERNEVMGAALAWLCAPPPGGLQLIPPLNFGSGVPGAAVPYTLTVVNDMGAADSFTLTYSSAWPIAGPSVVGPVDDGMTEDFVVTITVPTDSNCYDTDTAMVLAEAQSNPAFTDTAYIETTANPPGVGDVTGVVYDANTSLGIADAYVYLELGAYDYYETWADATGAYALPAVPICHYDGGVNAVGYFTEYFTATPPITLDLHLNAGWPDLSHDAVNVTMLPDTMYTVTMTLANTGTGDLYFHTSELPDDAIYPDSIPLGIDSQVYADLEAADDGTARFIVYMAEQADLTAAFGMIDWAARGQYVLDALRSTAARSQAGLLAELDRAGVEYESRYLVNAVVVEGDLALANNLIARSEVAFIGPDRVIAAPEPVEMLPGVDAGIDVPVWNVARINADDVWSTFGVTGTGVVVSNIDTGVLYTHAALVDGYRGNMGGGTFDHNYNWWDPYGDMPDYPYDWHSHGSHTIGTMAGGDYGGQEIGIAPGAQWIACNGFDHGGSGYTVELLECAEFILAPWDLTGANPDPAMRPHVVNNSWGGGPADWWYNQAIYAWRAAGIIGIFSAGNNGPSCETIGAPDYDNIMLVGATNNADVIASFSSRGPASVSGIMKPNVSAPGVNVVSAYNDGGLGGMSGTSMAAPHVAGMAALIWSAQPELIGNVELTYWLIEQTALGLTTTQECGGIPGDQIPNNTYGWGRIDAYEAVSLALSANWDIPWLMVDPVQGTVAPGGSESIDLVFDSTGLLVNTCYTGTLMVEYNDPYVLQELLPLEMCLADCLEITAVDFAWSPTTPTVGLMAFFTATVTGGTPPMTYTWDFGDGTAPVVVTGTTGIHVFTATGSFTVTLTVENPCSQADVLYVLTVEAVVPPEHKIYLPIIVRP